MKEQKEQGEESRKEREEMRGDKEVKKRGGGEGKKVEEGEKRVGRRNRGAEKQGEKE